MTELLQGKTSREFLTVGEQQVLIALEAMLGDTPKPAKGLSFLEGVQKEMRRQGLKKFTTSRIGQIIAALEKKGILSRTIVIVKRLKTVA